MVHFPSNADVLKNVSMISISYELLSRKPLDRWDMLPDLDIEDYTRADQNSLRRSKK